MAATPPPPPPPPSARPPSIRSPSPASTPLTAAAPSSPSLVLAHEMLSPSNSPTSPTHSAHRALSPPAVGSRSMSVPTSPPATNAAPSASTNAVAMSTTPAPPSLAHQNNTRDTPPTKKVLERNQACLGCRQRKRKCDGCKPSCGACERLDRPCVYTNNAVTKIHSSAHYRAEQSSLSTTRGSKTPAAHDPPIAMRGTSMTPSLTVPTVHRPTPSSTSGTGGGGGFTPVNADATGARVSPTFASSRLSPNLTNGSTTFNPRKRSFSSLDSSPDVSARAINPPSHTTHVECDATQFATQFLQASPFVGLAQIDTSHLLAGDDAVTDEMPELSDDGLPSPELMKVLFNLFFEKWHTILPFLYKKRVMEDIASKGPLTRPNTLTFAILALSGYLHPDAGVKAASSYWATLGKACFDRAVSEGQFTMHAVQGGIYLCLRMFGLSQMSQMWIFLGSVWRMCSPLGLDRIDSNSAFRGFLPDPRNELEIEERRRTVWAIFILDRLSTTSVPWPVCIDDSQFNVNFPVSEDVFQSGSLESVEHMVIDPFPNSLDGLVPSTMMGNSQSPQRDAYQHLCKLAVLLGRILHHPRPQRSSTESMALDLALTRFLLNIPKPYRSMIGVSPKEMPTVLLLGCTTHACTIFLHGRDEQDGEQRSVNAVENILTLIRNVSSTLDPDDDRVLGNPLLAPTLFMAARILCYRFVSQGGEGGNGNGTVRNQVEILLDALGRMEEGWPKLAGLMKTIICEDAKGDSKA